MKTNSCLYITACLSKSDRLLVRRFRETLEKRTTREYLPSAQALYDLLVRPLEQALTSERTDTLVFIPDDPLRTIPLAALHDGQDF
jgi:CHAT domain-containing protein